MDWEQTTAEDGLEEWTRADDNASIRLRRRTDDQFAVRLDRLYQANEGRGYEYEVVENREAAEQLVDEWQAEAVPADETSE
ncbi:hypothetical protein halTADL_3106 [Halohasta litchfieldiae]|jgi:hypothetical protein|uniref:Uncharacterized protein n=1 Tax=Halohasta litchfieldiae TaxID=1073996 RepID=A0A1H6RD29_9EURY|nr:hypothetical protein [Halohasta litchfieldiae]ATW89808.1 hypothetical protein halTADL_3106 [Halohasta litchfieldiae]SEI52396.1 hypothetical protein SAMN05444271_10218 [Halohasta litchfieldiae]